MILGLYDHPPPAGHDIVYRTVGRTNATWFLEQTQKQAVKWLLWARKIPPIIP